MADSKPSTRTQPPTLGSRAISLCIAIVLSLHVAYGVSYAYEAKRYFQQAVMDMKRINAITKALSIDLHADRHMARTLAATSTLLATWHFWGIVRAARASLLHRRLLLTTPETIQIAKLTRQLTSRMQSKRRLRGSCCTGCCKRVLAQIKHTFHRIHSTWREFFTIDGKRYELGAGIREIIEIRTQLHVVYRISGVAVSKRLNDLAAVVFILNCFSTPLVHLALGRKASAYVRRLGRHVLGMIFTALINIAMTNAMWSYVEAAAIKPEFWFDQVAATQLRFLGKETVINSWLRVVSTRGAMCMAIFALEGLKIRLSASNDPIKSVVAVSDVPLPESSSDPKTPDAKKPSIILRLFRLVVSFIRRIHIVDEFAVGMGILVLVAHIQAGMHPPPHTPGLQCDMPLHPWAVFKWPCGVVELNCHRAGVSGQASEIDTLLEKLDPGSVSAMRLTHCSRLEMPPRIKTFSNLAMFEVYNASLVRWEVESALTKTSHPHLGTLWLIRVQNLAQLPPGVLEPGFPSINVHVCVTDLTALPSDLDQRWPTDAVRVAIERSALSSVPDSLVRLNPIVVSVSRNQITTLPSVQLGSIVTPLGLADNPITALPDEGYANIDLDLRYTQVTKAPGWMTLPNVPRTLLAGGSPLCDGIETAQTKINAITLVCTLPASKDDVLTFPLGQIDAQRAL
ncbi:TPA: hypothetical protein N0F65_011962 [Lagenidium giganteum]|uniref:Uncharacterized protein n=1 Tax=Lagenidium giganteum TaxID=4803 RepID=A0AAV2Z9Q9_9STRA|nr:TPA: hypothetical protein N0F65_011962 [Lagenidium giganteum]